MVQRVLDKVVELAGFVPAQGQTGQVVPLDVKAAFAQNAGQRGHGLQGRVDIAHLCVTQIFNFHILALSVKTDERTNAGAVQV